MSHVFKLLSRNDFREGVFKRDNYRCVICHKTAGETPEKELYAHHILERRLWPDGGYYLENGATVCDIHHMECEMTRISVEQVREACGITHKCIPDTLYEDQLYDKWGNPMTWDGKRSIGPLFYDESVQKVLVEGGALDDFEMRVKACKTMHLKSSPGIHKDDRVMRNYQGFEGQEVVVGVKMDGENTMMYSDYIHARSIDGRGHPSRSWVKQFHAQIQGDIPERWRINGENVYAQHSIAYDSLETYFYGFAIWNEFNVRLDWDDMLMWFDLLGITPVRQLYRGPWDEKIINSLHKDLDLTKDEGFVVTTVKGFKFSEYHQKVAKWVREGHVQTNKHWMHGQPVIPNKLKEIK